MTIELLYGQDRLRIRLPDEVRVTVVRKAPMNPVPVPEAAVRRALEYPVGSPPLSEAARGKKSACILICDITRPVPNGTLLPPLVDTLTKAGISRENIRIVVATGLHRPNEGPELREVVGSDEVYRTVRVENHFARDREAHADLGRSSAGIPILIDRRFVEAQLKIVTGLVEPHFMAGYSGGRKVVAPGIAHQDTIIGLHGPRILEHPRSANCVIGGNPLHEAQIEIVRAIGGILAVNVAIDEHRNIGFVNFGEVEASHLEAVEFMRTCAEVVLPRRFRTVVTSAAGYPLDRTYYQTVKGMVGALDILEPGGTIIIASACSEGLGSSEFVAAQRLLRETGPDRFVSVLEARGRARVDEWQTEMLAKALRAGNVQLYTTGLTKADLEDVVVEPVFSVEAAVEASVRAQRDPDVAVIPEGPYVIPRCSRPAA
jgi:nickel-dependent lactate racemase